LHLGFNRADVLAVSLLNQQYSFHLSKDPVTAEEGLKFRKITNFQLFHAFPVNEVLF
jgi:hypothetical protein